MDLYHLWILPKGFQLPFGIHPFRDTQCPTVERGYDYDLKEVTAWVESPERKLLVGDGPDQFAILLESEV